MGIISSSVISVKYSVTNVIKIFYHHRKMTKLQTMLNYMSISFIDFVTIYIGKV